MGSEVLVLGLLIRRLFLLLLLPLLFVSLPTCPPSPLAFLLICSPQGGQKEEEPSLGHSGAGTQPPRDPFPRKAACRPGVWETTSQEACICASGRQPGGRT